MSFNEIEILVNGLTDSDTLLSGSGPASMIPAFCGIDLDRLVARGFDTSEKSAYRLALSLSLLIPLQVVPPFRMVFIMARNENVVADDFSVSFKNGREPPNPSDSNLLENIDPFGVVFGRAMASLKWGGHYSWVRDSVKRRKERTPKRTPKKVSD